jgi:hypothetical protein
MFFGKVRRGWMDGGDVNDTAGGCDLCEVEWQGTFAEVQQQFIDHKHGLLREVRYVLDVYPYAFGQERMYVEQLWLLALQQSEQIDGSGTSNEGSASVGS